MMDLMEDREVWQLNLEQQWCQFLLGIGGDNLQFYPNFALFLTFRGINLDHDCFQVSKLSEDQKQTDN